MNPVRLLPLLILAVTALLMGEPSSGAVAGLDSDGDGVPDAEDNCPAWHNPDQSLPSIPRYATDDPDCDGWSTADEEFIGTDPAKHCCDTPAAGDEPPPDAWPPDFDDDQRVTILDIVRYFCVIPELPFMLCGQYDARFDLNTDGSINILDIVQLTPPMFNSSCT